MDYRSVEEVRDLPGLRLVLTRGVPGPWGEAAKSIFQVKKIPFVAVAQYGGMDNPDLVAWTGRANAPVAVYGNEAPRDGWAEILFLAERLRPEPRLVPADEEDRALMLGLCFEMCGEQGFGWSRRLMLTDSLLLGRTPEPMRKVGETLGARYGHSKAAAEAAPGRVVAILRLLSAQLARQKAAGRRYLVGDTLSAADLYWAAFAVLVEPMPAELCPIPDMLRGFYADVGPVVAAAMDPALLEHRDRIYREHLPLPMDF